MMITGRVSSDNTSPPTSGAERGSAAQLIEQSRALQTKLTYRWYW
jgi:hypothetical protein